MKLGPYFTPYREINSKWIIVLNGRAKAIKLLEENAGINLCDLGLQRLLRYVRVRQRLLRYVTKSTSNKRENRQIGLHVKIKLLCFKGYQWKDNSQNGRKYLQIIYFIKGFYPECIKNSYNSITKRHVTQFKDGQIIWIDISPKKIFKWPISTWKDAQKCKSKPQWDTTSYIVG